MFLSSIGFLLPHMLLYVPETVLLPGFGTIGTSLCVIFLRLFNITIKVVCLQGFSFYFSANFSIKNKNRSQFPDSGFLFYLLFIIYAHRSYQTVPVRLLQHLLCAEHESSDHFRYKYHNVLLFVTTSPGCGLLTLVHPMNVSVVPRRL